MKNVLILKKRSFFFSRLNLLNHEIFSFYISSNKICVIFFFKRIFFQIEFCIFYSFETAFPNIFPAGGGPSEQRRISIGLLDLSSFLIGQSECLDGAGSEQNVKNNRKGIKLIKLDLQN